MHKLRSSFTLAIAMLCFAFPGCEIVTESPALPDFRPANHVVINEVFTLSPTSQAPYSWVELLNPTTQTVDITNWSLSFRSYKQRELFIVVLDSVFNFRSFISSQTILAELATHDVRFTRAFSPEEFLSPRIDTVQPNGLYTVVSNKNRLLDHTEWGPGPEETRFERPLFGVIDSAILVQYVRGDSIIYAIYGTSYIFQFQTTDQLVLKDPAGTPVDIVRYGGYTVLSTDPQPNNHSIGAIPEFESIARYAGGYSTDNTANDFYITRPTIRPIPHWYSQSYRR